MLSTLKPGQGVLCFNWAYIFSKPKIRDIVVIRYQGKEMIKRIQKYDGRQVFVTGDNKEESTDSKRFGPIGKSEIIGKVVYIVRATSENIQKKL